MSLVNTSESAKTEASASPAAHAPSGFAAFGLHEVLLRGVEAAGYSTPTPIQTEAIPAAMQGRDVVGCARTGTGKTAAFALPMLQHLMSARRPRGEAQRIRALILAPTRELAAQISESIASYSRGSGLRQLVIFGGVSQERQVSELRRGVDIVIATPGRLVDLIDQDLVRLDGVEQLVLDEFDRMLDQGFLPAIRRVLRGVPRERQTLLFSATMPPELEAVVKNIVRDPVRVAVSKTSSTPDKIDQAVWFLENTEKRAALEKVLRGPDIACAVVFTRTKHGANRVVKHLLAAGIEADAIHGNKSQNARERALGRFRDGSLRILVATDIAARGIDIDGISHVINYDLPPDPESYVHRIGRTARAGKSGAALSMCTAEERGTLQRIERLIGQRLRALNDTPPRGQAEAPRAPQPRAQTAQHSDRMPQRSDRSAQPRQDRHAQPARGSSTGGARAGTVSVGSWSPGGRRSGAALRAR